MIVVFGLLSLVALSFVVSFIPPPANFGKRNNSRLQ